MKYILICSLLLAMARTTWAEDAPDVFDALYDSIMIRDASDYRVFQKMMEGQVTVGETVGGDGVSPLVWRNSRFLIEGDTHSRFINALDGFISLSDQEIEALPEVKRAILQRHLWTLFDWNAELTRDPPSPMPVQERLAQYQLQRKLAALIRRLALSKVQISELPDTLAATAKSGVFPENCDPDDTFKPFFPSDLKDGKGPWVSCAPT